MFAAVTWGSISDGWLSLELAPDNIVTPSFLHWTPIGSATSEVAGAAQDPRREGNRRNVRELASKGDEIGSVALKHELVVVFVLLWNKKVTFLSSWKTAEKKECFGVSRLITFDTQ